jgi:hypothetical protein
MTVALDSYVYNVSELDLLTNYTVFRQLCTIDADNVEPDSALSGTRLNRAHVALNYGKEQVDAALSNVYNVPFTGPGQPATETWPAMVVKQWTVAFALLFLYRFHADRARELPDMLQELLDQIEPYIKPDGLVLSGHARDGQPGVGLAFGRPITGSIYDKAGYWSQQVIESQDGDADGVL